MQKNIVLILVVLMVVVAFFFAYLFYVSSIDIKEVQENDTKTVSKVEKERKTIDQNNSNKLTKESTNNTAMKVGDVTVEESDETVEITQKIIKKDELPKIKKPINEMQENELVDLLKPDNEPAYLIEVVNRLGTFKKISNPTIDYMLAFIGKKNTDVDAYIIKSLSIIGVDNEKVLLDLITMLKTNSNQVVRRCAADAIGEFKLAIPKIGELEALANIEADERVKQKLIKTIEKLKIIENRK